MSSGDLNRVYPSILSEVNVLKGGGGVKKDSYKTKRDIQTHRITTRYFAERYVITQHSYLSQLYISG